MLEPLKPKPLEEWPAAVLAEFIRARGISYFPEELQGAAERLAAKRAAAKARVELASPREIAQALATVASVSK
jgi:hypothetical protein